jgi:beta-glucosidase
VTVTNTGTRDGADVPQFYLTHVAGDVRKRLLGFERVELKPGESRRVGITADPRLPATFDREAIQWCITGGPHRVAVGRSADELVATADVTLRARLFGR